MDGYIGHTPASRTSAVDKINIRIFYGMWFSMQRSAGLKFSSRQNKRKVGLIFFTAFLVAGQYVIAYVFKCGVLCRQACQELLGEHFAYGKVESVSADFH